MELELLRTLTNRAFYNANKNVAKERIFRSKETRNIKQTIDRAMLDYENSINTSDIKALFLSLNTSLTTAQKDIIKVYFIKWKHVPP